MSPLTTAGASGTFVISSERMTSCTPFNSTPNSSLSK
jgi:hypothetical protein